MADPAQKGLWSPARGYMTGTAAAEAAGPKAAAAPAKAPAAKTGARAPAAVATSAGGKSSFWTPARGYLAAGGAAAAAPAAQAAGEVDEAVTAAAPAAAAEKTAAKSAAGAPRAAEKPAEKAAKKAPAKEKEAAVAAASAASEDPQRVSVTTVPGLTEHKVFRDVGRRVFDEPDSESTLYRVPALNVLFAVSSAALLVFLVLVFLQDYQREWKDIQAHWQESLEAQYRREAEEESARQLEALDRLGDPLRQMLAKVSPDGSEAAAQAARAQTRGTARQRFKAARDESSRLIARVREQLLSRPEAEFQEYRALRAEEERLRNEHDALDRELRFYRGDFQAAKFAHDDHKRHVLDEGKDRPEVLARVADLDGEFTAHWIAPMDDLDRRLEERKTEQKRAEAALNHHETALTAVPVEKSVSDTGSISLATLSGQLAGMVQKVESVEKRLRLVEDNWRNAFRDAPVVDFLAPTLMIDKVVIDDLHETLNFLTVPRIDRCKTCHINIDNPSPALAGYRDAEGGYGLVYASHPRLDRFLGGASPHPYEKFGCTTCHYGDGHRLEFGMAAHTPSSEAQAEHWEERYHWHKLHHQDFPMQPLTYIEASCGKCHPHEMRVEGADRYNLGKEIVRTYGCFGCHRIAGFEVARDAESDRERLGKVEKVGPSLKYVADKASPAFLYKWIRNPQHFRESTRMPRFFDLTNTGGGTGGENGAGKMTLLGNDGKTETLDFDARNGVEALALASYLYETSSRQLAAGAAEGQGDPARGRDFVRSLGCLGCHSVKVESMDEEARSGSLPPLAAVAGQEHPVPAGGALQKAAAAARQAAGALGGKGAGVDLLALAEKYEAVAVLLRRSYRWLERLGLGHSAEEYFHEIQTALEEARRLQESAGNSGADLAALRGASGENVLDAADRLARAFWSRWVHNTFAPDLSGVGRKFDLESAAGRARAWEWLRGWIVDPRRHDPGSAMPRFRLDENDPEDLQRIDDIVSYLLTLDFNGVDLAADPGFTPQTASAEARKALAERWENLHPALRADTLSSEHVAALDELAFDQLRRSGTREEARAFLAGLGNQEKLLFVGHRLVRRYGCFACHDGIRDRDFGPPPPAPSSSGPAVPAPANVGTNMARATPILGHEGPGAAFAVAYFDEAQPIGTELNGWGIKGVDRLDFGPWGHQHSGRVAIPHDRHAWARTKLSDTRIFDVFPVEKVVDRRRGVYAYEKSPRLVQKTPEELLKMPLFGFHDDSELLDAAVTYLLSLVNDPIPLAKTHTLNERKQALETGRRVIEKYNCKGCHRIGAVTRHLDVRLLPDPDADSPEAGRHNNMEQETWLAKGVELLPRPVGPGDRSRAKELAAALPAGFLADSRHRAFSLGLMSENERGFAVIDVARRHYDPLAGFIADFARALDDLVQEPAVPAANRAVLDFVTKLRDGPADDLLAVAAKSLLANYAAETPSKPLLKEFIDLMQRAEVGPFRVDLERWRERLGADWPPFADLARRYYGFDLPPAAVARERTLPVRAWGEGRARFYFGTDPLLRAYAPPVLLREGERVHGDWLFRFLLNVEPIRPWLTVRMPSFPMTVDEARALVAWFKADAGVPYANEVFPEERLDREKAEEGKVLFGAKGLSCFQCHPAGDSLPGEPTLTPAGRISPKEVPVTAPGDSFFLVWKDEGGKVGLRGGYKTADDARAEGERRFAQKPLPWAVGNPWDKISWGPDLSLAAQRLRPSWIRDWLGFPPDFMPGTKMPEFFGARKKFTGRYDSHLAVAKSVQDLADLDLPPDLSSEAAEALVRDENVKRAEQRRKIEALVQYLLHLGEVEAVSRAEGGAKPASGGGD